MLKKLRIKNYRTFEDVEIEFGRVNLLMGVNGSGKTSVFDVLAGLRALIVDGANVGQVFGPGTWPRLSVEVAVRHSSAESVFGPLPTKARTLGRGAEGDLQLEGQSFELSANFESVEYVYGVTILQPVHRGSVQIKRESLTADKKTLFERDGTAVQFGSSSGPISLESNGIGFSQSLSGVAVIAATGAIGEAVARFRSGVAQLSTFRPNAYAMSAEARASSFEPRRDLSDLGAWLLGLNETDPSKVSELVRLTSIVVPSLKDFRTFYRDDGDFKMHAQLHPLPVLSSEGEEVEPRVSLFLSLDELSEGQRNLIALYAILLTKLTTGATLCIDEPDNFVSLREIQPWLLEAMDRAEDNDAQLILASHHPELVDLIGGPHGLLFERTETGATTVRKFPVSDSPLHISEQLARGWIG